MKIRTAVLVCTIALSLAGCGSSTGVSTGSTGGGSSAKATGTVAGHKVSLPGSCDDTLVKMNGTMQVDFKDASNAFSVTFKSDMKSIKDGGNVTVTYLDKGVSNNISPTDPKYVTDSSFSLKGGHVAAKGVPIYDDTDGTFPGGDAGFDITWTC